LNTGENHVTHNCSYGGCAVFLENPVEKGINFDPHCIITFWAAEFYQQYDHLSLSRILMSLMQKKYQKHATVLNVAKINNLATFDRHAMECDNWHKVLQCTFCLGGKCIPNTLHRYME